MVITKVRARVYGYKASGDARSLQCRLLDNDNSEWHPEQTITSETPGWTDWVELTAPSSGFSLGNIQAFVLYVYLDAGTPEMFFARGEVEVTSYTINNIWGAETGGMEETSAFSGASATAEAARSGNYGYSLAQNDTIDFLPFESVADAGSGYVVGFWWACKNATGSGDVRLISVYEDGTLTSQFVRLIASHTSGAWNAVKVNNISGTQLTTSFTPVSGEDYFIEVYFEHSASGACEVFVDGASVGSVTGIDFDNGGTFDGLEIRQSSGSTGYWDDIYIISGATVASDRLGGCEIFAYRSTLASATGDTGQALSAGQWVDAQEIPFSETSYILFDAGNEYGEIDLDDAGGSADTGGPATDANIDGDANIRAMKGVWRAKRDGGSGTFHIGRMGNSLNNGSQTAVFELTTAYENYTATVNPYTAAVPNSSQYLLIGIHKGFGGQIFNCSDMLGMILHVPDPAPTSTIKQINPVAYATIKLVNSVTIATLKNINGVA